MDLKLKIDPVVCITAILILFSCLFLTGQKADAFRQVSPPAITPQPGPPPQALDDPSFYKWSTQEIINAFEESGLEVVNIQKGLTMGSHAAKDSTIFLIPSSGENIGGLVSSYRSRKELEEDSRYYSGMNDPSGPPAWRIFQRANILLLISGKVPEKQAARYKNVLEGM